MNPRDAFKSVAGHLLEIEGERLQRLADNKRVLEFGTHHGRSAVAMAATARQVSTVDHYRGDFQIGAPDIEQTRRGFAGSGLGHKISLYDCTWQQFVMDNCILSYLSPWHDDFDMIFYDAAHDQEGAFLGFVTDFKGIIALHDYKPGEAGMEHVVRAVDEFSAVTGRPIAGKVGSVVWFDAIQRQ
jgi:hypothetical protein